MKAVVVGLTDLAPTIERNYEQGWVLLQDHCRPAGRQMRLVFGSDNPDENPRPSLDLSDAAPTTT
jgi:hypothetical protein